MTTEVQQQRLKKLGRFLVIKVPIILAVLIVMMIASLKLVERYPEPLRQGFEDYLSRTYNSTATIGQLEQVEFFPNVHVRARDITMHNKNNAAVIDIAVNFIDMQAPFVSMIFGTGKIKNLDIKNLKAAANILLPKSLEVESLSISEKDGPDQYGAFLTVEGTYAKQNITLQAELEKVGDMYKVGKNIPFALSRGNARLSAQLLQKNKSKILLKNTVYATSNEQSSTQEYIFYESNVFEKENPLACLIDADAIQDCNQYLE